MRFDIARYKDATARLEVDDIDFDAFRTQPLGPDVLRTLRYMHDVEYHTVCYLRDLLVTSAHSDPDITAFLTLWNYEEHWHGEALARVLSAHGEAAGAPRIAALRRRVRWTQTVGPLVSMAGSALLRDFTAVHMAWGAVNEWTTQAGYGRLAARADHPELTRLLKRIMRQEGVHIDFYASQAASRLDASRAARWLTRLALTRFWRPVGSSVQPKAEVEFLVGYLFGDPAGRAVANRIDNRVHRLPGLDGIGIVGAAIGRIAGPAPAPSARDIPLGMAA